MNLTRWTILLALGLTLSFATTGCHPQNMQRIHGYRSPKVDDNRDDLAIRLRSLTNDGTGIPLTPPHTTFTRNVEFFRANTVHFDFDSSALKGDERGKVAAVADYLKSNPTHAVEVQGHCDERGTEEYNRSLGERRALAIRESLVGLGIEPSRIDTISFGEDKPAAMGHDDSAWRQNRRGEFILLTPPGQ